MRRRWLGITVAVALLGACGDDGPGAPVDAGGTPDASDGAVTATVGAVLSLTGTAAPYGESQRLGLELAVADAAADGVEIDLVVVDDQSDPDAGIAAFEQLIAQGASVIVGPTLSNTALATDPVAQEAGVPVLAVSNTVGDITALGDFVFRASLTEAQVIPETVARAAEAFELAEVAILHGEGDAFTAASYEVFVEALAAHEIEVVAEESFQLGDTDFSAQLDTLLSAEPDALVVSALATDGAAILTAAREAGYDGPILGGNGFNSPTVISTAGEAAEGLVVGAAWNRHSTEPASQEFVAAFEAANGTPPDQFAAQAYAGIEIVAEALRAAGSTDPAAVRDALAAIDDLSTPLGPFAFTEDREADARVAVAEIRNGDFQLLN